MKTTLFAMAALLFGTAGFAQNTGKLLGSYITVKEALVKGDDKAAAAAVRELQNGIKSEGDFARKAALLQAAERMAKAGGIEKQRAAFNDVSTTMWEVVKSSGERAEPVYYQYCPMKKAYWLSKEKEIRNPYYGSSMLTCGKVAETRN